MAKGFEVLSPQNTAMKEYDVKSGSAASIKNKMLVKEDGSNAGYVTKCANGETTSANIIGVALADSTDTASADGKVLIARGFPLRCRAKATTAANLAQATKNTKVTLDVSSNDNTVDEDDTSNGFIKVVDYDNTTDGNVIVEIDCEV